MKKAVSKNKNITNARKDGDIRWDLDAIVTLADWPQLKAEVETDLKKVKTWWGKLGPDMTENSFRSFMSWRDSFERKVSRLYYRAHLWEDTEDGSAEAKRMKGLARDLLVKVTEVWMPIDRWVKGLEVAGKDPLDDANATRLFKSAPDLDYSLSYGRASARYTLSAVEENLISLKNANGQSVLQDMREMLETRQEFELKVPGQPVKVFKTREQLAPYVRDSRPEYREAAYRSLLEVYKKQQDYFFLIYQAVVKDWAAMAKRRGFVSSIAMRNHDNQIPDRAIEVLQRVIAEEVGVFQEFFRWKAKELGMKKLRRFDLYAPMDRAKTKFSFDQALKLVTETFTSFAPGFAERAQRMIADKHIDVSPRVGKRGGAYCATVEPGLSPYVLLNYTNTWRDVTTVAHELGHGIHSLYANHLPLSVQQASLPLCETASTLSEVILFERLLEQAPDSKTRKLMLADKLADSYASIIRQSYFVQFEILAHTKIPEGITADGLGQLWHQTLVDQFGSSMSIDPLFAYEWAYIPHIVQEPFYCYSYCFGELLSLALYQRYKQEGDSFVPRVEKILAAGGAEDPVKVLAAVGIDISDPEFWRGSFAIIKEWMRELKS